MNFSNQLKKGRSAFAYVFCFALFLISASFGKAYAYDVVVAKDGSGNFTTIQAAITAAPTNSTVPYTIFIKNGKYREKISIPSTRTFIQLTGESVANVIVYYDDPATILGTQASASFTIGAADFSAFNITFANTYGDGSQAVAVVVNADRAVFKNCRFLGNQDTLYTKGGAPGKAYFINCYIDGNIDFIFGSSIALFDSCVVYAKSRTSAGSSFITAPNTPAGQAYGYVFRNGRFPANTGATSYFLSRPWPSPSEAATAQKTVLINARLSPSINPQGWTVWDANTVTSNTYYGEYNSTYFDGTPVDVSQRVSWSHQLTSTEASSYTPAAMFGAWDPCATYPGLCTPQATDIAVSNFRGAKGSTTSAFNWNISWPMTGIRYQLYRSSDNISFTQIDDQTAATDTLVNFQSSDAFPPAGSIYYYYIQASKAGYASHITDTIQISSKPTITTNSALGTFNQALGSPSPAQAYTVSGINLIDNLTITPPINYEVSANSGSTWATNASPLVITPVNNNVAGTTIQVRLNATANGTYTGNIVHTSSGADPVSIAVNGTTATAVPYPSRVLQVWPLTQDNTDSAAARSTTVLATTPTLSLLSVSDGAVSATTGVAIPSYSNNFGQALAPTAAGLWTTAAGGPGGTLSRRSYEQFVINIATGNTIRLDSVLLNASFVSTASNTKMALVFSKNGFTSPADSTELFSAYGGPTPANVTLAASGNFSKVVPLAQQNSGPMTPVLQNYRIALTNGSGITLSGGQSLTVRIYFACGSGSNGKYVTLRDFAVKGGVVIALPLKLLSFGAVREAGGGRLLWRTANEAATAYFDVEKSDNGREFASLGHVAARNGASENTYTLLDASLANTAYYRVKTIADNGAATYSAVVKLNGQAQALGIYPNPVTNSVQVLHGTAADNAVIAVYSVNGRLVKTVPVSKGVIQTTVNVSALAAGTYVVKFTDNGRTATDVLIKQ